MEFTREVVIDCYQQAKLKQPYTDEELEYNKLLDRKIDDED